LVEVSDVAVQVGNEFSSVWAGNSHFNSNYRVCTLCDPCDVGVQVGASEHDADAIAQLDGLNVPYSTKFFAACSFFCMFIPFFVDVARVFTPFEDERIGSTRFVKSINQPIVYHCVTPCLSSRLLNVLLFLLSLFSFVWVCHFCLSLIVTWFAELQQLSLGLLFVFTFFAIWFIVCVVVLAFAFSFSWLSFFLTSILLLVATSLFLMIGFLFYFLSLSGWGRVWAIVTFLWRFFILGEPIKEADILFVLWSFVHFFITFRFLLALLLQFLLTIIVRWLLRVPILRFFNSRMLYSPHLVSSAKQDVNFTIDMSPSVLRTNLRAAVQRHAMLPIPAILIDEIHDGSVEVAFASLMGDHFTLGASLRL
jgi:hypothetical protein